MAEWGRRTSLPGVCLGRRPGAQALAALAAQAAQALAVVMLGAATVPPPVGGRPIAP